MLPERSVGLMFADLVATMRTSLPDIDLSVTVTQFPSSPRIGRLAVITHADKPTVDDALSTALVDEARQAFELHRRLFDELMVACGQADQAVR